MRLKVACMRLLAVGLVILVLSAVGPAVPALACVLNNQSSLSANGNLALKNFGSASGGGPPAIPFYFARVYGQGQAVRVAESYADLRKTLSASQLAHPFLWRWGDGTDSTGSSVAHMYRKTGTYDSSVYAFGLQQGGSGWAPFDQAKIQIVPAGEVWRDNLWQDALDVLAIVVIWGGRLFLATLASLLIWGFWADWRHPRRARSRRKLGRRSPQLRVDNYVDVGPR